MTDTPGDMAAWLDAEAQIAEDSARHYDNDGETAMVDPLRQQTERLRAAASMLRECAEREKALREALTEIARVDFGGMQGISEAHNFDPDDYPPEESLKRLQAWRDEEVQYLMNRIAARRSIAAKALEAK